MYISKRRSITIVYGASVCNVTVMPSAQRLTFALPLCQQEKLCHPVVFSPHRSYLVSFARDA